MKKHVRRGRAKKKVNTKERERGQKEAEEIWGEKSNREGEREV